MEEAVPAVAYLHYLLNEPQAAEQAAEGTEDLELTGDPGWDELVKAQRRRK